MFFAFACALVATVSYGVGSVLQAVGARRAAGSEHLDVTLFGRLARQWLYLAGLALDAVGFVASVIALETLPLFVVQGAVAGSLGVTAALAPIVFGFRLGTPAKVALGALLLGLLLLGISARSEEVADLSDLGGWTLLAGVVIVAAAGGIAARSSRNSGIALAACAGLGFGGAAIAARALVVPTPAWHIVGEPIAIALVAYGACGLLMFASALQRGSVTPTSAVMLAVETIVPAIVGLVALGDRTREHFEIVAAVGFAMTLGACLALARYAEPDQLIEDRAG
jgi:drug/metabolite transporter (DMT)-like permease